LSAASGTVLITGATGMIGRHAAADLERRGFRVIATARRNAPVSCDLLAQGERRALIGAHRPSHLLHLAWETRHGHFWTAPENDQWLAASRDLLRVFAAAGGKRAVVAGTCAEYDWPRLGARPVAETALLGPKTPYGIAKHALHRALAELAAQEGLSYAWGRVFLLVGAGEHPDRLVPSVARALLANLPANCTAGRQRRDFMDTRDAGAGFAALLASEVAGAVNIGTGVAHSVAEAAETLGRLSGRPDLIRLGALPSRADDPPYLVADTGRLAAEVGFRAEIGFERMLADALEWWRQQGKIA